MTRHRVVEGLVYAAPCERPDFIPQARLRGSRAAGLRYERRVGAALPQARGGLWFHFLDRNGPGHCNPDLVLDLGDVLAVLECKLTETEQGRLQISELYRPVLRYALGREVIGVQVARNLTPRTDLGVVVHSLSEALTRARGGDIPTLHWVERGPL